MMKIRNKVLFTVLFFLSTLFINARNPISFGVKAGINFSTSSCDGENNFNQEGKEGFKIYFSGEYGFTDNLFIQSGLSFTTKGIKFKEEDLSYNYEYSETLNQLYLQIPLMAAYKFDVARNIKLYTNGGPYLAYGIGGKRNHNLRFDEEKLSYDNETFSDGSLKKIDFGLGIGFGTELNKIIVGLSYELGLTNIHQEKETEYRNRSASFTIGYKF